MKNSEVINFDYNGSMIPFVFNGNDYMINATEMAKSMCKTKADYDSKRPYRWIRSKEAQEYIQALLTGRNLASEDLIVTHEGGSNYSGVRGGTWMHRLVAIRYAQWLEPRFAVWVDMKIDEIISQGYAFRDAEIQRLQGETNRLQGEVGNLNSMIQSMQPQVNYYNNVLSHSKNTYTLRDICGEGKICVGNKRLMRLLVDNGYVYKDPGNKKWFLKHPWSNEGYTTVITVFDKSGNPRNVKRWTEEGRHWIYSIAKKLKILV